MNRALQLIKAINLLSEAEKPWDKPHPKKKSRRLTKKQKANAKSWAKRHNKPYPSLVANMHGAKS